MLEPRGRRTPAARSDRVEWLRVPGGADVGGGVRGLPHRRGTDHVRRSSQRRLESVAARDGRIGADAVEISRPAETEMITAAGARSSRLAGTRLNSVSPAAARAARATR